MADHTSPPEEGHESVWFPPSDRTDYDSLDGDRSVDTAVVGGGIAGITTAAKLDEAEDGPVAVYRDDGEIHARSAVCPHMGYLVSWNDGEQSWDCPCHGSRFDVDGEGLDTPVVDGLADVPLPDGPDP